MTDLLRFSIRGSTLPAEQLAQLQDKAQQELLMVRQRLEDKLNQERRAMHSVLVKKRRELISDMVKRTTLRRRSPVQIPSVNGGSENLRGAPGSYSHPTRFSSPVADPQPEAA